MSGLPADLARLLERKDDVADVEFEVGGKVFAAHKLVLAARSPVFQADLFGAAKEEATGYVRICDMHPDTGGRGGARREEEEAAAAVLAQDLLVAADRYGHRGLKSFIESELCRHNVVGVDTVLPMLALAERHQCWKLKNKCLEFTSSSGATARAVMATDDVKHLTRSCPSAVKELVKILEAKEATPSRRPRMDSADALSFFFLALAFILACILPSGIVNLS
ncbi:BTB/POZ and MATH domain-containing protein 2-like [Miscanthus floridulus]|uniref:BTB/POZ and MATH domain-containing protein 2-like n=1 Tax=Miscanthus floridulus TaxID=154761 RepID=UPI0034577A98